MNRDQALSKIKKCLALAKSGNANEAATALRQAQALMTAHSLTERDMSMVDVQEVSVKATSPALNVWEVKLAVLVAEAFGCEQYGQFTSRLNAAFNYIRERHCVFVGIDSAPTVAAYAFEVLSRQCARDRLAHIRKQPRNCKPITKTARGDEFARAWVFAVSSLVEKFANPERDEALLLAYMEDRHPDLRTIKPRDTTKRRRIDSGHSLAGFEAGKKAQLNRGVGAFAPKGLLA
ncbi:MULTISPECIES: DUF2786 domain-containing protein [unclassified Variovorax]|uniref:DUF2786 domain-containing protein n=1 Tax=unclassified Variovorax TaxID=663243 RepID=UPI003F483324